MKKATQDRFELLILWDILSKESSEMSPMLGEEILEKMEERGVKITEERMVADIAMLNKYGFDVQCFKQKLKYYYVFSMSGPYKSVLLSDPVEDLDPPKPQKKFLNLDRNVAADKATKNIVYFDEIRNGNKPLIENVCCIGRALEKGKKIAFLHYRLDFNQDKVYYHNGRRVIVNPLVMVRRCDNYYLVCYDDNQELQNYRLDRIELVWIEREYVTEFLDFDKFDLESYCRQCFSMHGGKKTRIALSLPEEYIDDAYERFGEDMDICRVDDKNYILYVVVRLNLFFYSWVASSCGFMKIVAPVNAREKMRLFAREVKEGYYDLPKTQ